MLFNIIMREHLTPINELQSCTNSISVKFSSFFNIPQSRLSSFSEGIWEAYTFTTRVKVLLCFL